MGESIYLEEQPIRHPRIYPNWMCCETEPAAASDHFPLSKGENHSCCKRRRKHGRNTTGIQILRHGIIFRISNGLPLGTSNPDTWRLKPSNSCQLPVDHSELCTNVIFNFSQLILKASARKKFNICLRAKCCTWLQWLWSHP